MADLGYDLSTIRQCPSEIAITGPFRILSDEGVAELRRITEQLKSVRSQGPNNRVPSYLAGGIYRSRFLSDLCACPAIADHLSKISGTRLVPHTLPSQRVYVNYAPQDITKAVDNWHFDGIGFDYVLMLSDPQDLYGGEFEFFQGTRDEISRRFDLPIPLIRKGISDDLPRERVISMRFPAAGYALFQQGNLVIHRATRLRKPAERTTVIPGYVSTQCEYPDPTAVHDIVGYREPGINIELARHSAWLTSHRLQNLIDNLQGDEDPASVVTALRDAISSVMHTAELIEEFHNNKRSG